jgi:excisionase family DNA binding protein
VEKLLTADEAAVLLGTTERLPRRLIAERRIRFARVGRHVRIPLSALDACARPDLGFKRGAGDGNRTRTVSLGS